MINAENPVGTQNEPGPSEPVKIILAEDDKDDQEFFRDALDAAQVPNEVVTVENGQQLIDMLKDEDEPNPDIIFIDINMPVKNGKQALAEIRKEKDLRDIPAVMLTTSGQPDDIEESFKTGANLYIQKPNSFSGFVLILKKVFTLHWTKVLMDPLKNIFFLSEKDISPKD